MTINYAKEAMDLAGLLANYGRPIEHGQAMVSPIANFLEAFAQRVRDADFDDLLDKSSLGSPDVKAASARTDPAVVDEIMRRVAEKDRQAKADHEERVRADERRQVRDKAHELAIKYVLPEEVAAFDRELAAPDTHPTGKQTIRLVLDDEALATLAKLRDGTTATSLVEAIRDAVGVYSTLFDLQESGAEFALARNDLTFHALEIPTLRRMP